MLSPPPPLKMDSWNIRLMHKCNIIMIVFSSSTLVYTRSVLWNKAKLYLPTRFPFLYSVVAIQLSSDAGWVGALEPMLLCVAMAHDDECALAMAHSSIIDLVAARLNGKIALCDS